MATGGGSQGEPGGRGGCERLPPPAPVVQKLPSHPALLFSQSHLLFPWLAMAAAGPEFEVHVLGHPKGGPEGHEGQLGACGAGCRSPAAAACRHLPASQPRTPLQPATSWCTTHASALMRIGVGWRSKMAGDPPLAPAAASSLFRLLAVNKVAGATAQAPSPTACCCCWRSGSCPTRSTLWMWRASQTGGWRLGWGRELARCTAPSLLVMTAPCGVVRVVCAGQGWPCGVGWPWAGPGGRAGPGGCAALLPGGAALAAAAGELCSPSSRVEPSCPGSSAAPPPPSLSRRCGS